MKPIAALALAAVTTLGVLVATPATAHPGASGKSHKPTGTIFFFRENHAGNGQNIFSMTAAGKSAHQVAHVDADIAAYPAPKAHVIAYGHTPAPFKRWLRIATYRGKIKHTYKPKNLVQVLSISPNGKYVGDELTGPKVSFDIASGKGKTVATLFKAATSTPTDAKEAWNPNGKQIAVLATNEDTNKSTLKTYNLHGKVLKTLATNLAGGSGVSWSTSGIIAYAVGRTILEVRDTGGATHVLIGLGTSFASGVSYSPNGAFIAYSVDTAATPSVEQLWRAKSDGTSRHRLTNKGSQPYWG
jgi:hypothetical protein